MKNQGWVLLHRKVYLSNDFSNELDRSVFIYLLCKASYEPVSVVYRMKRIALNRGELLVTHGDLAKRFCCSIQNIRTIIKRLKLTGTLTVSLTRGLMRIRIEKYIKYQDIDKKKTTKLTGSLTNRTKNTNKLNKSIYTTNESNNNIYDMKKIKIDKSSKPSLKNLNTAIYEKKNMTEFEVARKTLSTDRFEEFVRLKLQSDSKS